MTFLDFINFSVVLLDERNQTHFGCWTTACLPTGLWHFPTTGIRRGEVTLRKPLPQRRWSWFGRRAWSSTMDRACSEPLPEPLQRDKQLACGETLLGHEALVSVPDPRLAYLSVLKNFAYMQRAELACLCHPHDCNIPTLCPHQFHLFRVRMEFAHHIHTVCLGCSLLIEHNPKFL